MTTLVESELRSVNPATLEVVGSVPVTADVAAVVAAVREAWRPPTLSDRRALLVRLARAGLAPAPGIGAAVTAGTGKPPAEAVPPQRFPPRAPPAWAPQ